METPEKNCDQALANMAGGQIDKWRGVKMVQSASMNGWRACVLACVLVTLAGSVHAQDAKPAQPNVASANQSVQSQLPFGDRQDFEDAARGFIATIPDPGNPDRTAFLKQEPPATVNPSLWREAQLDAINGLFKVTDGVYQVRGLSVAAMTIIEARRGIIVIDTLASPGEARTALDLYFSHRPRKPLLAVIYTHDHGDHYSGASALLSPADATSGKIKVIAPLGFMDALTEEAVVASNLAARRGQFQFGASLPVGERGTVEYGEGQVTTRGPAGAGPIVPPNDIIRRPIETRTIDGIKFVNSSLRWTRKRLRKCSCTCRSRMSWMWRRTRRTRCTIFCPFAARWYATGFHGRKPSIRRSINSAATCKS